MQRIAALEQKSERIRSRIEYEADETRSTRDRMQASFGDQQEGHHAAMLLDTAMGQLLEAAGMLGGLQGNAEALVARIRS